MAWFLIIVAVIVARKLYKRHERKHAEHKRGRCKRRNSQPNIYTSHGCGRGSRRCGYGRGHWNQPVAVASSSHANASAPPAEERQPITYTRTEQKQIIKAAKGLSREEIEQHIGTLKRLFPDCDPEFIRQLLIREDHDHVERTANRLAETAYPTIVQPQGTSQSASMSQAYQDEDIMDAPPSYEQAMLTPPPQSPRRSSWNGPERPQYESGGEREPRGLFQRIARVVKS